MGLFSYSHTPRCLPASSGPCADCASDIQYCIFPSKQFLFINFNSSLYHWTASCKVHCLAPARSYSALMSRRLDPPDKYGTPTLSQVSTNWKMIRKELQEGQTSWKTCLALVDERAGCKVTCQQRRSPHFGRMVLVRDRYSDEQNNT